MRTNVFLRSTRRQPVKALCLALMIAFVTFAFVGRVSEYLLVRQETERLEDYYRSSADLESLGGDPWADTSEAVAYLEARPDVEAVNTYDYLSGVMEEDFCNADTDLLSNGQSRYLAFYGRVVVDGLPTFRVETVLAGLPEYVREGGMASISSADAAGKAPDALKAGQSYLVLGQYIPDSPACSAGWGEGGTYRTNALSVSDNQDNWYYPVDGEADWSAPALSYAADFIHQAREEQRSLNIIPLRDMSALPMVQEADPALYLTAGRWLDSEDDAQGRRVCVINDNLATLRGLEVGDTLFIKLRDVPARFGYFDGCDDPFAQDMDTETGEYEIVGIYDYRELYQRTVTRNFTYIPASVVPEGFQGASAETVSTERFYFQMEDIVPPSAAPLPYPGAVSFVLTSPDEEARFMAETRSDLEHMGFRASFLDNGLEDFRAAAGPMRQSSLYNALIYSAILLAAFALAAFVYFFLRRRELAIVRALGVPVKTCVKQISLPLGLIGLPGVLLGGTLGWRYTLVNAAKTLEALAEFGDGSVSALPVYWLILLWASAAALLLALTVGSAAMLSRRPVLEQMQGGSAVKEKRRTARQDAIAASGGGVRVSELSFEAAALALREPLPRTRSLGVAHTLRFVWRHVSRARVKSLLAVALAAGFTVGLGAIRLSIAANRQEVDRLYETTSVSIELTKADSTQTTTAGSFLFEDTAQSILDTGFITDTYLEGANYCQVFLYDGPWERETNLFINPDQQTKRTIRSIDNAEAFLTAGSGMDASITYLGDWTAELFAENWAEKDAQAPDSDPVRFPMVVPKETYDEYGLQPGDSMGVACKGRFHMCEIAGYYEGEVAGEYHNGPEVHVYYDESAPILMPTSALRSMVKNMLYSKAVFTVDPAKNRELDAFRAVVDELANTPRIGGVPVRTILRDEELRLAIEPIENSIRLMEVLYPVALVLSLLAAAGVSVLFVMLSAKEAAILRVQGTTRFRTVLMLSLQQVFTCFAGLLAGLIGILLYIGGTRPDLLTGLAPGAALCAGLYLTAGVTGAAVSSAAVTGKNPLEMLQVKE